MLFISTAIARKLDFRELGGGRRKVVGRGGVRWEGALGSRETYWEVDEGIFLLIKFCLVVLLFSS